MMRISVLVLLAAAVAMAQEPKRDLKDVLSVRRKVGVVTAVSNEIGLVVISAGRDQGLMEGDEIEICRKDELIARLMVDRVDRKWSAGKILTRKSEPRAADEVYAKTPFTVGEKKEVLDYAFAFRPLKEEDRDRVATVLAGFESDDIAVREGASKELLKLGGLASGVLRSMDLSKMSAEVQGRVKDSLLELDRYNRMLNSPGLERDIVFLSSIDDPRGYERLKRILSGVRPFSLKGFPGKDKGLPEYLSVWWASSKDRVRWNVREDRFEDVR